jgi:hypothetical protein
MCASRSLEPAYLRSPSPATAVERSIAAPLLRPWREKLTSWLIGSLAKADELPPRYLANNHLRRDIGLPPAMPDGWPH